MKQTINLGDKKVTLIGTAHVSEQSRIEVEEAIDEIKPDHVMVELDQKRFESLRDEDGWKDLDVPDAIREGKGSMLFMNLVLSIYQRRMGLEEGVKPGAEMLEAIERAEENNIEYSLIDRDVSETFGRARDELTFFEKAKLLTLFYIGETDVEVEDLKEEDMLDSLIKELEAEFPKLKEVFLDERNRFMANKILEKDFEHAVVVVGAAHLEGIKEILENEGKTQEVELLDDSFSIPWMKFVKYGIPTLVIGMLAYSFFQLDFSTGLRASGYWIFTNGIFSLIGAVIARSHVTTWIISFLAAPLTSLNPTIGAGMVASYAEGKMYPPKVGELEKIAYIDGYRELWGNQVGRILLTFVFVTFGSVVATFLGAGIIGSIIAAA